MEKKYRTRSGLPARILCTDRNHPDYPVVTLILEKCGKESISNYTKDLTYSLNHGHSLDLIEVTPYDHIKIDDPVLVYDSLKGEKHKRHFAGVNEKGQPLTWCEGRTSFTTNDNIEWNYCEKVEITPSEN